MPLLGERSQEDPDFLTSHRCQVPLRVYPIPHCFPSNWSFPGNFRKRKVSPFYKRGHQVPEKEAFSLPSQVSQGEEPSVRTPSPVLFSSFSPKLPRTRAKSPPTTSQATATDSRTHRFVWGSSSQCQSKGPLLSLRAWGTHSSGLCPRLFQCFVARPGCQSLLWQRLPKC